MPLDTGDLDKTVLAPRGAIEKKWIFKVVNGEVIRLAYYTPDNPKTPGQQTLRSLLACGTRTWRHITEEEREEWRQKVNRPFRCMTGFNLYVSEYINAGVEMAVKQIIPGTKHCVDGVNDDPIATVDPTRCIVICQEARSLVMCDETWQWVGVIVVGVLDANTVRIICTIPEGCPEMDVGYFVVEFV